MLDYFGGTFRHKVDAKGRVSLPAKFRKTAENSGVAGEEIHMIMSKDKSHIIAFLSSEVRRRLSSVKENETIGLPEGADDDLRTAYFSGSSSSAVDGAGRIGLHRSHKRRAGIDKECIFDGMGDYFVIYTQDRFVDMKRAKDAEYDLEEELG